MHDVAREVCLPSKKCAETNRRVTLLPKEWLDAVIFFIELKAEKLVHRLYNCLLRERTGFRLLVGKSLKNSSG